MKICIVASNGQSLYNFRGPLIRSWVNKGYEVICISIEPKEEIEHKIKDLGASYIQVSGDRTGISIGKGLKMIKDYEKVFKDINPDILFLYMSKPVAFGGLAAIRTKMEHINILVNGLENAYYRKTLKDFVVRKVMNYFYRKVSKKSDNVFFQNEHDYQFFIKKGFLKKKNGFVVSGSGVDMNYFEKKELPDKKVVLMSARLLWSKGIREYFEAAKVLKRKYPDLELQLLGGFDENDEAISKSEMNELMKDGNINYLGRTNDVRPYLENCSIFCLPSYHEGLPRSVLEAMATGRAIVTTKTPGCSDTVIDGYNGYLIEPKNSNQLIEKISILIENPEKIIAMGNNSFELCKSKFEVNLVNKEMNNKMEEKL